MSGERELVTDFASLRAGDYVEVMPCTYCHGAHGGILLRLQTGGVWDAAGGHLTETTWTFTGGRCLASKLTSARSGDIVIAATTVDRRIVFRIDTGLEAPTQETAKRRTPARAR